MDDVAHYRVAPTLLVRLIGSLLVLLAVLTAVVALLVVVLGWPGDVVVVVVLGGLVFMLSMIALLRWRLDVVRLDADGYRVWPLRGVGVRAGRWSDVVEAAAMRPGGVPCLLLRRRDGTSTTIPVDVLAGDGDDFARDVRARLRRAAASAVE